MSETPQVLENDQAIVEKVQQLVNGSENKVQTDLSNVLPGGLGDILSVGDLLKLNDSVGDLLRLNETIQDEADPAFSSMSSNLIPSLNLPIDNKPSQELKESDLTNLTEALPVPITPTNIRQMVLVKPS